MQRGNGCRFLLERPEWDNRKPLTLLYTDGSSIGLMVRYQTAPCAGKPAKQDSNLRPPSIGRHCWRNLCAAPSAATSEILGLVVVGLQLSRHDAAAPSTPTTAHRKEQGVGGNGHRTNSPHFPHVFAGVRESFTDSSGGERDEGGEPKPFIGSGSPWCRMAGLNCRPQPYQGSVR